MIAIGVVVRAVLCQVGAFCVVLACCIWAVSFRSVKGTCLSYPNKALEKHGDCWSVQVRVFSNRIVKSCTKLSRPVFSFASDLFGAEGLSISTSSSRHLRCGETEACMLLLSHHIDCLFALVFS